MNLDMALRNETTMMARVRDEAAWIARCVRTAFAVCGSVVLWDDESTDGTQMLALAAMEEDFKIASRESHPSRDTYHGMGDAGAAILHVVRSPYRPAQGPYAANEMRDRDALWWYVRTHCPHRVVLCLDGDEALSKAAIRAWPDWCEMMERGNVDVIVPPFVYTWDAPDRQRVDGIYGDASDGIKMLRFPRVFSTARCSTNEVAAMRFAAARGPAGLHTGSIPFEGYNPAGLMEPRRWTVREPIAHYGYERDAERMEKFAFYTAVDGHNLAEGGYLHIIGKPNGLAPGPVRTEPWEDE